MPTKSPIVITFSMLAMMAAPVPANDNSPPRCADCGCSSFRNVCRLECQMKEDIDYEYDVDYDPYCLPGVSEIQGKKWVPDCNTWLGCRKVLTWKPRCLCKVHTRKTLVKIPVVKKVPVYNCVVDRVCCKCGNSEVDPKATAQAREQGLMPERTDVPMVFDSGEFDSSDAMLASRQSNRR